MMTGGTEKSLIEAVNPVAETAEQKAVIPARRPDSLDGKTIALWWNSKSRGDDALKTVAEMLEKRYTNVKFVWFSQQYDHGRHFPERYDEVKQRGCDVAILTSGD
ncbi:hypothetical protein ACFLTV_02150 [Chloroflexota bacterium]